MKNLRQYYEEVLAASLRDQEVNRKLASIYVEPDPATFDARLDDLACEIADAHPDGPDLYTIKERLMAHANQTIDIMTETGDE